MLNNFGLGFIFSATDRVSGAALKIDSILNRMEKSATRAGRALDKQAAMGTAGLATFAAGVSGLGAAIAAADYAGGFEQQLAGIGAVAKASVQDMEKARNRVIRAGMDTQFSPMEALEGMQNLVTAGQTISEAGETLTPVLDLAAGSLGMIGVAEAGEAVIGTLNSYGMAANEATNITNRLLRITQLTNFTARDFKWALAKAASTGAQFNQSLDDVTIAIGLMRNANIDAASSGNAFRESVRRVGAMQTKTARVVAAGVEVYDKQTGKMREIIDIMGDLVDVTKDYSDEKRNELLNMVFGTRGITLFNAVARAQFKTMKDGKLVTYEGREAIRRMRIEQAMAGADMSKLDKLTEGLSDRTDILARAQKEAGGTAKEFRDTLLDTYQGQKTLLGGVTQTIGVLLGETLAKGFKPIVAWLGTTATSVAEWLNGLAPQWKQFISFTFVAISGMLMLGGGFIAVRFTMIAFNATLRMVGLSMKSIVRSFMVINFWIVAAVAAGYLLYKAYRTNFGGLADFINRVVRKVKLVWNGLVQVFSQGGFSGAVRKELGMAENSGIKRFIINVYALVHRLMVLWEGLSDAFMSVWAGVEPVITELGNVISELASEIWKDLQPVFDLMDDGTGTSVSGWRKFGAIIGKVLGYTILILAKLIVWGVKAFVWAYRIGKAIVNFGISVFKWGVYILTVPLRIIAGFVQLAIAIGKVLAYIIVRIYHLARIIIEPIFIALRIIGGFFWGLFTNYVWPVMKKIGWAIWLVGKIMFVVLALPFVAVGKAFYAVWKFLKAKVWDPFANAIAGVYDRIAKVLGPVWTRFVRGIILTWKGIKKVVWDPFYATVTAIADKIAWIIDSLPSLSFTGMFDDIEQEQRIENATPENTVRFLDTFGVIPPGLSFDQKENFVKMYAGGDTNAAMAYAKQMASKNNAIMERAKSDPNVQKNAELLAEKIKQIVAAPIVVQVNGDTIATAARQGDARNMSLGYDYSESSEE